MHVELITAEARYARYERRDDSAEFIIEALDWIRLGKVPGNRIGEWRKIKFSELRAIAKLKANNWRIQKGQLYIKQFCKQHGELYTFCTLPHILRICTKYKLYGDN
jgi:hypothetical protein